MNIEIRSGIESEVKTRLGVQSFAQDYENGSVLTFQFTCVSALVCKSLQVLLAPYFKDYSPIIKVNNIVLSISIDIPVLPFTESFKLDLTLGVPIDSIQETSIFEVFESLLFRLETTNSHEILSFVGLGYLKISAANMSLVLDPEDIPKLIFDYFDENLSQASKISEVLVAIRPFLAEAKIEVVYKGHRINLQGFLHY